MLAFCPLCASDDATKHDRASDGRVFAVCHAKEHGSEGFVWEPTLSGKHSTRGDGLGSELDIWDKLLECIPVDGVPHSYGEVEDVFFERYSANAALLKRAFRRWVSDRRRDRIIHGPHPPRSIVGSRRCQVVDSLDHDRA